MASSHAIALVLAGVLCLPCLTAMQAVEVLGVSGMMREVAAPPPPSPVPPNASRITGTVRKYSIWAPGSLQGTRPPAPPDRTLYSVTVSIQTSETESSGLDDLAQPGFILEAFTVEELAADLVGKPIEATVKLTGDTRGVRWWISGIRILP